MGRLFLLKSVRIKTNTVIEEDEVKKIKSRKEKKEQ